MLVFLSSLAFGAVQPETTWSPAAQCEIMTPTQVSDFDDALDAWEDEVVPPTVIECAFVLVELLLQGWECSQIGNLYSDCLERRLADPTLPPNMCLGLSMAASDCWDSYHNVEDIYNSEGCGVSPG